MIAWLFKNIFRLASATVMFATFLSYAAAYVHPRSNSWISHFGTAFPWLLLCNLALIIFWALNFKRFAIYHAVLLLVGWTHVTAFFGFSKASPKSEKSITVMSHNVGNILQGKNLEKEWSKTISEYVTFLKNHGDPDVICLQECDGVVRDLILNKCGYPHHFGLSKGTVILSRFPIDGGADIPFANTGNSALSVNLHLRQGKVRLYNLHLQSNYISGHADKLLQSGNIEDKHSWLKARDILVAVGSQTRKRAEQVTQVLHNMEQEQLPVLLCGDFNDTPNSYVYRLMAEKLTDTFQTKGRGLGYTFAGSLPLLRIDYVFASEHFRVLDAGVIHKKTSDHYPTYAVIELE